MAQLKQRWNPLYKMLMATGTLGGGGIGAYQFVPPAETAPVAAKSATLDAAAEAWGGDQAQAPLPAPSSDLLASLPLGGSTVNAGPAVQATAPPATAPASRYAASEFSLPLAPLSEPIDEPITRGQNPSDEYDDAAGGLDEELLAQAPPSVINPLRSAPQSLPPSDTAPARAAFEGAREAAPRRRSPPSALPQVTISRCGRWRRLSRSTPQ